MDLYRLLFHANIQHVYAYEYTSYILLIFEILSMNLFRIRSKLTRRVLWLVSMTSLALLRRYNHHNE